MIIDSRMTRDEALRQNPAMPCPKDILDKLELVTAPYWGFDGAEHRGQIVVHADLTVDVIALFTHLHGLRFPLGSVIPISHPRFAWSDDASMAANNCSGFNYRTIAGKTKLSKHAVGRAIDLNPVQNPIIRNYIVGPPGAVWNPAKPGTFRSNGPVVGFLKTRGWVWGGDWTSFKDYHHFQKS